MHKPLKIMPNYSNITVMVSNHQMEPVTDIYLVYLMRLYEICDTYLFNLIHDILPIFHQTTSK